MKKRLTIPTLLFVATLAIAGAIRFWQLPQVPYTLWVDEAWFSLRARDVVRGNSFIPIIRPGLGVGDSPMQVYLAALVQLLGISAPYSARITSAVVGTLTIGLFYPSLIDFWRTEHGKSKACWMSLAATGVMATLFTHIHASRLGMQYALAPAFTLLTLWLTWIALRDLKINYAAGAGVTLGLSQYTYESLRALPILLGAFCLLFVIQASPENRKHLGRLVAVIVGVSVLIFLPIGLIYLRDPTIYFLHMRDVSQGVLSGKPHQVLIQVLVNYGRVLGGISWRGDILPGRNLVGRPMLNPYLSIFFCLGVIQALRRFKTSHSAQLWILWLFIMLIPTAMADEAPATNRMLAAGPAMAALVGLGMSWVWQKLGQRFSRENHRLFRYGVWSLIVIGLVLSQAQSTYDYFVRWANDPRLFSAIKAGDRMFVERALELAQTDQVYLTPVSDPFLAPVYDLLLEDSTVRTVEGNVCLPLVDRPTESVDYGVVIVYDRESLPLLKSVYLGGREIDVIMHPDGYTYAVFFQAPVGAPGPAPQYRVDTEFSGGPRLIGFDISTSSPNPGSVLEITLYWLGTSDKMDDLVSFIHIGKGRQSDPLIAQHDAQICGHTYPTSRWLAGEILRDRHLLVVAADAPADRYDIAVGLYRPSDLMRLDVVQSDHPYQDNRVLIGALTIKP